MPFLSEHLLQAKLVSKFSKEYPGIRIFAIPNGGERNIAVARKMKMEGVSPGVPDLYIPACHTWLEVKTEVGKLSEAQKDWHQYLESVGDTVLVGYGYDDCWPLLEKTIQEMEEKWAGLEY